MYTNVLHLPGIGLSHHQTIIFTPFVAQSDRAEKLFVTKRDQRMQNRLNLKTAISEVSWNNLYNTTFCEEKFNIFMNVINSLIDKHLPYHTVQRNCNDHPWVTDKFLHLIKKRQYYFQSGNYVMYRFFRNRVNRDRKQLKTNYVRNTMSELKKQNPKQWWNHIKTISGLKKQTNGLNSLAQKECNGDISMLADKINQTFKEVSYHLSPLPPLIPEEPYIIPDKYIIPVKKVEIQLSKLNVNKAPGPDGIPTWLLRDMSHELGSPICSI